MKLTRNEPELRERLHEAVDSMSLFEIIVLLFLVQYIRVSGAVKSLPRPRKALPEKIEPLFDKRGRITNGGTVEFTQEDIDRLHAMANMAIQDAMRNTHRRDIETRTREAILNNTPYPSLAPGEYQQPTGFFVGDGPSGPEGGFTYISLDEISPLDPRAGIDQAAFNRVQDVVRNASSEVPGTFGYCTPSRAPITGEWARDTAGNPICDLAP